MGRLLTSLGTDESCCNLSAKTVVLETAQGPVTIRAQCRPGSFCRLGMDAGLGHFSQYSSIIHRSESFEAIASREGGRVALAVVEPFLVVGYLTCWYALPGDRWYSLGGLLYEMGAIEVSRNYRGMGIARRMMEITLQDDFFQDKIAFAKGLSWHWDCGAAGLSPAEYRGMLMRLCDGFGFREVHTNEPGIGFRTENFLLIRVGERVSADDQKRFRFLRFGITYPQ